MLKDIDHTDYLLLGGILLALWSGKLLTRLPQEQLVWGAAAHAAIHALLLGLLAATNTSRGGWALDWRPRLVVLGAPAGAALFVLAGIAYATSSGVLGLDPPAERSLLPDHLGPLLLLLLAGALLTAVLEEWLFRGVILGALTERLPTTLSVAVSAVLFALYHLSAFQLLPTFLLGLGLGYLTVRTGSLVPSITAHLLFNLLGLLLGALANPG